MEDLSECGILLNGAAKIRRLIGQAAEAIANGSIAVNSWLTSCRLGRSDM
jgi:hypothetical protein